MHLPQFEINYSWTHISTHVYTHILYYYQIKYFRTFQDCVWWICSIFSYCDSRMNPITLSNLWVNKKLEMFKNDVGSYSLWINITNIIVSIYGTFYLPIHELVAPSVIICLSGDRHYYSKMAFILLDLYLEMWYERVHTFQQEEKETRSFDKLFLLLSILLREASFF